MLTPDQITAISPDAASLKAGRDLGTPRKWQSLGGDATALWGLAQGSGKEPYQTRVALLQQTLTDLARDGLASPAARDRATWENLARRMIDCQAPGLAGNLRHIADTILPDPDVDSELPHELGRLHLLLHTITGSPQDPALRAEILAQIGGKNTAQQA